ncbi:MAG: ATP-dependent helicase [Elainellaceae cyanobacterium]
MLAQRIDQLQQMLRQGQRPIADWQGGALAVSAVPGSGKSTGMAIATAVLLAKRYQARQADIAAEGEASKNALGALANLESQLILVTFTRSAAANLRAKIRGYLRDLSVPSVGFAVYTLHSLALNIATHHAEQSGINLEQMTLISPNQSHRIVRTCVERWIVESPDRYQRLLEGQQNDNEQTERLRRESVLRTEVLPDLTHTVIHEAKSSGLSPETLEQINQEMLLFKSASDPNEDADADPYEVLAIAAGLYRHYQQLLRQRGFIDYDDMIIAALKVLHDPEIRTLWQSQVMAVFEDEAQDSSPLQSQLIQLLAGGNPEGVGQFTSSHLNLVRVGDPNQAINSTFTPADPIFFRQFCDQCREQNRLTEMEQAGRSSPMILQAANTLLSWVNQTYGFTPLPFRPQAIHPVSVDDPQPDANPAPEGRGLELYRPDTPVHSIRQIAQRVAELFTAQPQRNAVVLVRENKQARHVAHVLRHPEEYELGVDLEALGIDIYDVGQRDRHSHIPGELLPLLQFLNRPHSPDRLKAALQVLVQRRLVQPQDLNALVTSPEQFLYPSPIDPPQSETVQQARRYCANLLRARIELPPYQLIPFLALTLKYDQAELATADKLAERIARQMIEEQSLSALIEVLNEIVRSERFEAIDPDDPDTRYTRSHQLTIMTMHKAKGLDWDFVFLPFLYDIVIPGSLRVLPQRQFLGPMSLPETTRAQIRASIHHGLPIPNLEQAWNQAADLKVAEEFRLLYVAMTRAKRLLWMSAEQQGPFTWNKPEALSRRSPCPAIPMLVQWRAAQQDEVEPR